ncbi:hypothetical protein QJQ45_003077 [Haematococcus lacustris]|nr:hypothetical protein QJQ45_003077 [Haematococcus lacustris]
MAQAANLRAAAATALLLLPPSFSTQDFLVKLVGLSYHGDVRMGLAEDPHKVATQLGFQSPESHFSPGSVTLQDVTWAAIKSGDHQQLVARALHNTVRASSLWQAAAGLLAAGGGKSVAYVAAKMAKAFRTAKYIKRTEAEQAAEPVQHTKPTKGKAAKAKPAPKPGRWVYRDRHMALSMQRIEESKQRSLELCWRPEQLKLPYKGREYPGLGYKRLGDPAPPGPAAAAASS